MTDYTVDRERYLQRSGGKQPSTEVYVRAKLDDKYAAYDVADLDTPSLRAWLRSRGGDNPWAESFVLHLLCHEQMD